MPNMMKELPKLTKKEIEILCILLGLCRDPSYRGMPISIQELALTSKERVVYLCDLWRRDAEKTMYERIYRKLTK